MQSVTDRSLTASLLYGNTVYIRQDIQNMAYHLKYIIELYMAARSNVTQE